MSGIITKYYAYIRNRLLQAPVYGRFDFNGTSRSTAIGCTSEQRKALKTNTKPI